jgi:hypothetical protein
MFEAKIAALEAATAVLEPNTDLGYRALLSVIA